MGVETIAGIAIPLIAGALEKGMSQSQDSGVAAANANKLALMGQAQKDLGAYRPQLMGAEMGAMNRQLGAYHGAQDALATMYGGKPSTPMGVLPDPSVLGRNNPASTRQSPFGITPDPLVKPQDQTGKSFSGGPVPMPSAMMPPGRAPSIGNGPPMGSPPKGLPDPMQFLGKKVP